MRFTSYHCVKGEERNFDCKFIPARCVEVGEEIGCLLTECGIPAADTAWAFATCRIEVMGKDAHNDNGEALRSKGSTFNYGQMRWVHTRLQIHTPGKVPTAAFQRRDRGHFAWSDSFAGANAILDCFGLSMSDVLDHFGNVQPTERKVFDLTTIIEAMASEILTTKRAATMKIA